MKEYILAFLNGSLSFFSPCVLPLIPGYISLISGFSLKEISDGKNIEREKLFWFSFFFVIGFSLVFSMLGAFSSLAGSFLIKNRILFQKISGVLLFLIGIHISGLFRFSFLDYEKRKVFKISNPSYIASFITGVSFAFGWSPCIGPFLAATLTIAANSNVFNGMMMLLIYSIGMGIPFILFSVFSNYFFKLMIGRKRIIVLLEKLSGGLIAAIGILIFFDKFSL